MTLEVKSELAKPVEGKAAWHGLYYQDKQWNYVRNQQGNVISYINPEAAKAAARAELLLGGHHE